MKHKLYENTKCPQGYKKIDESDVLNHDEKDIKIVGDLYCLRIKENTNNSTNNQKPKSKTTPVILTPQDIWAGKVVEQGMEGDIVKLIQDQLKKKEFLEITTTTRLFGTLTKKAVVNFQNANGIPVTGKVDSVTWNKLFAGTNYEEKKPKEPEKVGIGKLSNTLKYLDSTKRNQEPKYLDSTKRSQEPKVKILRVLGGLNEQVNDSKTDDEKKKMLINFSTIKDENGRTCLDKAITNNELSFHPELGRRIYLIQRSNDGTKYVSYVFKSRNPKTGEVDNFYVVSDGNKVFGFFENDDDLEIDLECETSKIPDEVQTIVTNAGWTLQEPPLSSEDYTTKKDIRVVFPRLAKYFPNGKSIFFTGNTLSTKEQVITNELVNNIRALTGEVNKKFCKDAVDVLWDAKQGSERGVEYFTGTTDLQIVRQYVKRCAKELEKNMFDRVLGSKTKDHYKVLVGMRHYDSPQSKFNLGENNNSLEKTIKKKLMEMKKVKSALIS